MARPADEHADEHAVPLLLVHGTTADHTTFRVVGPRFARTRPTVSMDRRGRGGSGDTPPYTIEREHEDVAAVADAVAAIARGPVDVLGHSYGGRCALGAALLTHRIRRLVAYESAVPERTGAAIRGLVARLEALAAAGRPEAVLETFLREVVGETPEEWAAFRSSPVWPERVAAAGTVPRELRAGANPRTTAKPYAHVAVPVLQILGGASPASFRAGAEALQRRLPAGRIVVIDGARHAAHHTHADAFVAAVEAFLGEP